MRDFLENFYEVTKLTEGRESTVNKILPAIDFLLVQFDLEALNHASGSYMAASVEAGFKKLRKY